MSDTEQQELWLNIYPDPEKNCINNWTFDIREDADKYADPSRIACVRVLFKKGDGLK